jgi:hypothetical protein
MMVLRIKGEYLGGNEFGEVGVTLFFIMTSTVFIMDLFG